MSELEVKAETLYIYIQLSIVRIIHTPVPGLLPISVFDNLDNFDISG